MTRKSDISSFYKGKSVFITGATGFLGQAVIEKILYSCSEVDRIFILIRDKKNVNSFARASEYTNSSAFERLRNEKSELLKKIVPVKGDIIEKNLGLSSEDLDAIIHNVSVVFHSAATVNFNEKLNKSFKLNTMGTQHVLDICHQMKRLQALIHVSTAYSHTETDEVEEKVYPPPADFKRAREIAEKYSDIEPLVQNLIGQKPNTYTLTKELAEVVVLRRHQHIPTAIVRPSIVIGALKEPAPGWTVGWSASNVVLGLGGSGFTKFQLGKHDATIDFVPVDIVSNLMIVAATKCTVSSDLKVYNCCTGSSNPTKVGDMTNIFKKVSNKYLYRLLPFSFCTTIENRTLYEILSFFFHMLLAMICDLFAYFVPSSKPGYLTKIQKMHAKTIEVSRFFLINQWTFKDSNVRNLWLNMTEEDQKTFNFDVKSIEWDKCYENHILGVRKYVMKIKVPEPVNCKH